MTVGYVGVAGVGYVALVARLVGKLVFGLTATMRVLNAVASHPQQDNDLLRARR